MRSELRAFKFRFMNGDKYCKAIVLAECLEAAQEILEADYMEYGISILIDEFEELLDAEVVMTSFD